MSLAELSTPILLGLATIAALFVAFGLIVLATYRKQARAAGYASVSDYAKAVPRSDLEKRYAVDLALRGAVLCLLGFAFGAFLPLILIGLFPLSHGLRKMAYASMGLGLVDDPEHFSG